MEIINAFKRGNKVFICGNGGSASQSNHFAAEFVGKYKKERQPLPAISLAANQSILTAIGNDFGFEYIFSRQIEALGQKGDILIILSTSGKSKNCIKARETAIGKGMLVIDFPMLGDDVGDIQNRQVAMMHEICQEVEDSL